MKTQFRGRPCGDIEVDFLQGALGREFLTEYNRRVKLDYKDNKNLKVLSEFCGFIVGSNPFAVVAAGQILREANLGTATQVDLEKSLRFEALDLRGTSEDTGLVLRNESNPNSYLAGDLSRQLRKKNKSFEYPVLVNLTDLELRKDSNSNYGLAFKLREDIKPIYAPVLNQSSGSRFSSSDIDIFTGLPSQIRKEGLRCLWTIEHGLSRLGLDRVLDLGSSGAFLAASFSAGRIVVVSGTGIQ